MFILANRNIVLTTQDGTQTHALRRGSLCEVPNRFCDTAYFKDLVKDGKIVVPATRRDKDVEAAARAGEEGPEEAVKKPRRGKG